VGATYGWRKIPISLIDLVPGEQNGKLAITPVGVEKGTKGVISSDFLPFHRRTVNKLRAGFRAISAQK
jgi:hypothetical protein